MSITTSSAALGAAPSRICTVGFVSVQFVPIVGGPTPPIGSPVAGSTTCALPETSPEADATPGTDSTVGNNVSGTGSRSSIAPLPGPVALGAKACSARTTTSEPAAASVNNWSNALFIVSVSTNVPATKPTPSTIEITVSATALAGEEPFQGGAKHEGQPSSDFSLSRTDAAVGSRISSTMSPSARNTTRSA